MTVRGESIGAATWTERYEALRRYVLEGRQRLPSPPLGLGLWVAKGMAGWMRQWARLLEPTPVPVWALPLAPGPEPGPWHQPLTVLLAQIALAHLETPRAL